MLDISTYSLIEQTSHLHPTNYGKNESSFYRNEKKMIFLNTRVSIRDVIDKKIQKISP